MTINCRGTVGLTNVQRVKCGDAATALEVLRKVGDTPDAVVAAC